MKQFQLWSAIWNKAEWLLSFYDLLSEVFSTDFLGKPQQMYPQKQDYLKKKKKRKKGDYEGATSLNTVTLIEFLSFQRIQNFINQVSLIRHYYTKNNNKQYNRIASINRLNLKKVRKWENQPAFHQRYFEQLTAEKLRDAWHLSQSQLNQGTEFLYLGKFLMAPKS